MGGPLSGGAGTWVRTSIGGPRCLPTPGDLVTQDTPNRRLSDPNRTAKHLRTTIDNCFSVILVKDRRNIATDSSG
jgi:hypothetical protein